MSLDALTIARVLGAIDPSHGFPDPLRRVLAAWLNSGGEDRDAQVAQAAQGQITITYEAVAADTLALLGRRGVRIADPPEYGSADERLAWVAEYATALETAMARAECALVPRAVLDSFVELRADEGSKPAAGGSDTFAMSGASRELWDLRVGVARYDLRTKSTQMSLPFDRETKELNAGAMARAHLGGDVLRAWIADWFLAAEFDDANPLRAGLGLFDYDLRHVILDLYGMKPQYTTVRGKRYERAPTQAMDRLHAAHGRLAETYVHAIGRGPGSVVLKPAQPLIFRYEESGGPRVTCQHAPATLIDMRRSATQFPTRALRLAADDMPLANGLASMFRRCVHEALRAGQVRRTGAQFAALVGVDVAAAEARYGANKFWARFYGQTPRVAKDGGFGAVTVRGSGRNAEVTAVMSTALARAYSTLPKAMERRVEAEASGAKAKTGRPPKTPKALR